MQDPDLPLVFTRSQAVLLGLTRHAVTWRAHAERFHPLRAGAFCTTEIWTAATVDQRHLLTGLAAVAGPHRLETISHLTAALAYGWPGPIDPPGEPWFTIDPRRHVSTRRRSGVIRQVAPLPPEHERSIGGLRLTSPARTVADCLRHLPAEISVPIADAAVAAGVSVDRIVAVLRWQEQWPYAARAMASVALVDGRRESWLESRSAVSQHRLGWPTGEPQVDIFDTRGLFVGRVDQLWAELGVIGEADGGSKFRLAAGADPRLDSQPDLVSVEALREEKLREDKLRDLGYEMVRWTTSDALHPGRGLAERFQRAVARARPAQVVGTARPSAVPGVRPVQALGIAGLIDLALGRPLLLGVQPYSSSAGDLAS